MAAESQLEVLVSQLVPVCVCLPDFPPPDPIRVGRLGSGREGQMRGGEGREEEGAEERGRALGKGGMTTIKPLFGSQNSTNLIHTRCLPANGSLLIMFPAAAALERDHLTRVWKISQIKRGEHLERPLLLRRRGGVAGSSPG